MLILGAILDLQSGAGGWQQILTLTAWSLAKTLLFMAAVVFVVRLIRYSSGRITVSKQQFGHLLVWLKGKEALFATLSDLIGLHFIIGAFFGAMILGHESIGRWNCADSCDSVAFARRILAVPTWRITLLIGIMPRQDSLLTLHAQEQRIDACSRRLTYALAPNVCLASRLHTFATNLHE